MSKSNLREEVEKRGQRRRKEGSNFKWVMASIAWREGGREGGGEGGGKESQRILRNPVPLLLVAEFN